MNVPLRARLAALAAGALTTLALTATPAAAATPLPTPGTPVATTVTQTSITITWAASAGPVANYTVQEIDNSSVTTNTWHPIATVSGTTYTHTGLTADRVYEYRIIANPVAGSGYTASDPSGYIAVTTAPLPDNQPPTKPGFTYVSGVTTKSATVNTTFSTDNNRVAGYWVQRQVNGVWTDWATNNITTIYLRDLTPNTTYTFVVVAFDPNGNRSPRSDPVTFTTRATQPAPTCKVSLTNFYSGYIATVTVENMTAATVLQSWTVTFTLPAAHTVTSTFNGTITRSGDRATIVPPVYAATINPGGSAQPGFNASYPAGSPLPSGFALNATGLAAPIACTA